MKSYILLLLAGSLSVGILSSFGQNMLPQGSFEPATNPKSVMSSSVQWGSLVTIEGDGSNHFLKVEKPQGEMRHVVVRIPVQLDPSVSAYDVSLIAEAVVGGKGAQSWDVPKVFMGLLDASGKSMQPWPGEFAFTESTDGAQEFTKRITSVPEALTLQIEVTFQGGSWGTIAVDNLSVTPVGGGVISSAPSAAPAATVSQLSPAETAVSPSGRVVFEDDFSTTGDLNRSQPDVAAEPWRSEPGMIYAQNGKLQVYSGSEAFVKMAAPLGAGQTLKLTMVTDTDTGMFSRRASSGLSFFGGGAEKNFIGSPGNSNIWKVTGNRMLGNYDAPAIQYPNHVNISSSKAELVFTYNYDTGAWKATIGEASASGLGIKGVAMDEIRVGSFGQEGSITFDQIRVELIDN